MSYGENIVDVPAPWFVRLWYRWRPREGYAVLLLAWVAVFMLPLAVQTGELLEGIGPAQWLSTLALVLGWALAHTNLRGWSAALISALAGIAATLYWGVYVVRLGPLFSQLTARAGWLLGDRDTSAPPFTFWAAQGELLSSFWQRVQIWVNGLVSGRGGIDNLVVLFFAASLAWALAAWAGWWIARHGQAFTALLPTGALLAQISYWTPDVIWALVVFIAASAILLVLTRLWWQVSAWDAAGVDYAEDIRLDASMTALAIGLLVFAIAPTVPSIASGELSRRFWAIFESPYEKVEQQLGRSFERVRPARSLVPPTGAAEGGLPRAHLLQGARELGEKQALRVSVRGNTAGLQLYWRGQTYATYTGRGWEDVTAPQVERLDAGEPWQQAGSLDTSGGGWEPRTLVSTVKVIGASRAVIYGPSEPVGVDRPYRAAFRAPGELIALSPQSTPDSYTVLSRALPPAPDLLRGAGMDYPTVISQLYLQLPPVLEPRLRSLAAEWTAGATTPYDTALALERNLRQLPYSLDLPTPPEGRELVSWFLFDLRTGYCDYYASAMVVLSRLAGIPARLAIGYATGDFDPTTGEYVVTELNAHTWPELYFPGAGWIPFEPTAYQPVPDRPADEAAWKRPPELPSYIPGPEDYESGLEQLQTAATAATAETRRRTAGQLSLVALNGLAAAWAVWLMLDSRTRPAGPGAASQAFARLQAWGRRLGARPHPGDTPREATARLQAAAASVATTARLGPPAARAAGVVDQQSAALTAAYERELFAPGAPPRLVHASRPAARPVPWRPLWPALRSLWLARLLGKRKGRNPAATAPK